MSMKNELVSPIYTENTNKFKNKEILTKLEIQDPDIDIKSLDKINLLLNCIYAYIPAISDEYNLSTLQWVKLKDTLKWKFIKNHIYKFFEKVIDSDLLFEYCFQIWLENIESEINKNLDKNKVNISTLTKEKIQYFKSKIFEHIQKLDYRVDYNNIIIENSLNYYVDKNIKKEKAQRIIDLFIEENILDQSTISSIPLEMLRIELILLNLYNKLKSLLNHLIIALEKESYSSDFYTLDIKWFPIWIIDIFNAFIGKEKHITYKEFARKLNYFDIKWSDLSQNIIKFLSNNSSQDQNIPAYSKSYNANKKNILENLDTKLVYKEFEIACKKLNKLIEWIPDLIFVKGNNQVIQSSNYFVMMNLLFEIKLWFNNHLYNESEIKELETKYNQYILDPIIEFINQHDLMIKLFVNDIYEYIRLLLINQSNWSLIIDKSFYEKKDYTKLLSEQKWILFNELCLWLKQMIDHSFTNMHILNTIFEYLNRYLANNNIAILDFQIINTKLWSDIIKKLDNYSYLHRSLNNIWNIDTLIITKNIFKRIVNIDGYSKQIYNKKAINHIINPQLPSILDTLKSIVQY